MVRGGHGARQNEEERMELKKQTSRERVHALSCREPVYRLSTTGPQTLWFVTMGRVDSEVEDVMFKIETWRDLAYQFRGGLDPDEILDTFSDEQSARTKAMAVIAGGPAVYGTRS
jgi:hypothetical protein